MTTISLRNRKGETVAYTKIDEEDFDKVNKYKWNLSIYGYAQGSKAARLHRFILDAKKGDVVDHINGDKLDNRKSNLRIVSHSQNAQNRKKKEECSSNYIGVWLDKKSMNKKWICSVRTNDSSKKSFAFEKEDHAAYWYDQLALKYYGKDARINKICKADDFIEPNIENRELPKGVYPTKSEKYMTCIYYNKKQHYLGIFETVEEAEKVYKNKKTELKDNIKIDPEIKRNKDGVAVILTSKNEEIVVDDDKYSELMKYTWHINNNGYAITQENNKSITMHLYLMNPENEEIIDHINGNRTDNRLSNLRKSDRSLNGHNKIKQIGLSSKYIGVWLVKKTGKYQSAIRKGDKRYHVGRFEIEEEAARAYNKKALELFGEHANLNNLDLLQTK
jgi:hypothetical protein